MLDECNRLEMDSENRFSDLETVQRVHVELRAQLCCDFLNEDSCKKELTRFKLRCRDHLKSPDEQSLSVPFEILDKLEAKGLFVEEKYDILKELLRGYAAALDLITEAENRIAWIKAKLASPPAKKKKMENTESALEANVNGEVVTNLRDRLIEINTLETENIPMTPFRDDLKMPVEQLYASVVIREDMKYNSRKRGFAGNWEKHKKKTVKSPGDLLYVDGKYARRIYMQGDAARGKTTYCLWLLNQWCDAKRNTDIFQNEWQRAMNEFDFAFYIPLRSVQQSRITVADMICKDVLHEYPNLHQTTEHILFNEKYKCLILIDGLDEWNQEDQDIQKLRCKSLPNFDGILNCVYLITMRPMRFNAVAQSIQNNDKVIEMRGLNRRGIRKVIKNVLINHFGLIHKSQIYRIRYREIDDFLSGPTLDSFVQIPIVAVMCVQIKYKRLCEPNSMTGFFAVMIDMIIERACQKDNKLHSPEPQVDASLPKPLSEYENIKKYYGILLKLGKVAYEGIMNKQQKLLFKEGKLDKEIRMEELQFALDAGLISQRDKSTEISKNVQIEFFHSSIQEYLATIYIMSREEIKKSFCSNLINDKNLSELHNIIMFIFGLCPSLGSAVTEQLFSLVNDISHSNELPDSEDSLVFLMIWYQIEVSWYRELFATTEKTMMTFKVLFMYLSKHSDQEEVEVTKRILVDDNILIKFMFFDSVPADGECCITDKELNVFLANSERINSLWTLQICGRSTDRSIHTISGSSIENLFLSDVKVSKMDDNEVECPPLLGDLPKLIRLRLANISLNDGKLGFSSEMISLRYIWFRCVNMSVSEWQLFIRILSDEERRIDVKLYHTNIDESSIEIVKSSPKFEERKKDMNKLFFVRKCPTPQASSDANDRDHLAEYIDLYVESDCNLYSDDSLDTDDDDDDAYNEDGDDDGDDYGDDDDGDDNGDDDDDGDDYGDDDDGDDYGDDDDGDDYGDDDDGDDNGDDDDDGDDYGDDDDGDDYGDDDDGDDYGDDDDGDDYDNDDENYDEEHQQQQKEEEGDNDFHGDIEDNDVI